MSKEYIEALKIVDNAIKKYSHMSFNLLEANAILSLEEALQRLESIDNANPSEALECVEDLIFNFSVDEYVDRYDNNLQVIKQALLKQQEPKHYLKWEDLEFKEKQQVMDVLLNGKPYVLDYKYFTYEHNVIRLYTSEKELVLNCCGDYDFDIQFFNDLHLERVEE